MEPSIIKNHGFIDKYIACDAIMVSVRLQCRRCSQGQLMLKSLDEYNQHRISRSHNNLLKLDCINTGSLMLGTAGSTNRMDGTVIGDVGEF
jgi:adenylate cyclase